MTGLQLHLQIEVDAPFASGASRSGGVDEPLLRRVVERALAAAALSGSVEVTLVVTDDEEVRRLNAQFRGIDQTTDVLSFPLDPGGPAAPGAPRFVTPPGQPRHLGDVVLSYPRAVEQAQEYGHSLRRELAYLTVHGVLHLLGYDHEVEAERAAMREREEAALAEVPRE